MDRLHELTKYITKEMVGIEIGPWFSPIAPKREGYQCLALDVFDYQTLIERAKIDPFIPKDKIANIEKVDLVGSSVEIEKLVQDMDMIEKVDYILSSHNFEHLPNPIRFLQGCDKVLKPGGILSMAIPDLRTCFDYFRSPTILPDWLEAYLTGRERPNYKQIFEQNSLHSQYQRDGDTLITFFLTDDPAYITPPKTLRDAFEKWQNDLANQETTYQDVHCSTFTPASFELLMNELKYLNLTKLKLFEISVTNGCEFYVHLTRSPSSESIVDEDGFLARRKRLLHCINSEKAFNSLEAFQNRTDLNNANNKVDELQNENDRTNKESQHQIHQLTNILDSFITSKSWRLTSPFRSIAGWFRRLGNKFRGYTKFQGGY